MAEKRSTGSAGPAEWAMAALSTLLVLGAVAFLLVEGLSEQRPPAFRVEVLEVRSAGGDFIAEVRVRNIGETTAADVEIEGRPRGAAQARGERAAARLDYVPGGSERRVGLVFRTDPREHGVEARVVGYTMP